MDLKIVREVLSSCYFELESIQKLKEDEGEIKKDALGLNLLLRRK